MSLRPLGSTETEIRVNGEFIENFEQVDDSTYDVLIDAILSNDTHEPSRSGSTTLESDGSPHPDEILASIDSSNHMDYTLDYYLSVDMLEGSGHSRTALFIDGEKEDEAYAGGAGESDTVSGTYTKTFDNAEIEAYTNGKADFSGSLTLVIELTNSAELSTPSISKE